jgi:predicted transcriptional regulator
MRGLKFYAPKFHELSISLNTTLRKIRENFESFIWELSSRVQEQSSKVESIERARTTTRTITILATVIGLNSCNPSNLCDNNG